MSTAPEYYMGTQGFDGSWTESNISELVAQLDVANIKHYDTAALYPITNPGGAESLLGKVRQPDFVIDTKLLYRPEALRKGNMEESIRSSLQNLGVQQVNTLYAHAPDQSVPLVDQAANFDALYRAGLFHQLGLCNYSATQVKEWIEIATEKGYTLPRVYQGQYNIFCRQYEKDLFPLLRTNGIKFVANSPLAGGFATGKLTLAKDAEQLVGTRFEKSKGNLMGGLYRMWYDKPLFHDAVRKLQVAAAEVGVPSIAEASLRWLLFHSGLTSTDAVAIGPTKISQLDGYLTAREAGPLPAGLVVQIEKVYDDTMRTEAAPLVEIGWWSV
ncbi:Aldo/keto reductase [Penicillium malachiteum]|uniref:Aldo/keto reductase n=1 Tax=Penicillium malachiteum TaxID=1324776 RepID=UPI002547688D|nr:Aldo/keto reductase [Penicillium malachiteum]KAJ5715967.1 Aldo/keto reductase [Penicillium malachiteum]